MNSKIRPLDGNVELNKHRDLHFRLGAFLSLTVDDMIVNSRSVSIDRAVEISGKSRSTVYAWLNELEGRKLIDFDNGLIIVRGVVFEDIR